MTDTQLQLAIAKMLPEKLLITQGNFAGMDYSVIDWIKEERRVQETEWEHIVRLAEETLIKAQETAGSDMTNPDYALWTRYISHLRDVCGKGYCNHVHASWQQRAQAILKVKQLNDICKALTNLQKKVEL